MGENGLTASDVALLNNDGMNGGWGGMIWLFAILAMMGGSFGWNGGGAGNSNAIQNDINRGFDNQNLQAQTRDILAAVNAASMIDDSSKYSLINSISDVLSSITNSLIFSILSSYHISHTFNII